MRRIALIAALILLAAPLHPARADSALGDPCSIAGAVYTDAESVNYLGVGAKTFICDGSFSQTYTTALANPTRMGINTTSPTATLDVNGDIRLGDGTQNCSHATDTGAIRYNSATFKLQSCKNGTGWTDVGSGLATPAGSNTQVQLNDAGVFYASSGLTFNSSTGALTVTSGGAAATAGVFSNTRTNGATLGVSGTAASTGTAYAVKGSNTAAANTGAGVYGLNAGTGVNYGVEGANSSTGAASAAVYGVETGNAANYGGYFTNSSTTTAAAGIYGASSNATATATYGVRGDNTGSSNIGAGVLGTNVTTGVNFGTEGSNTSVTAGAAGVYGVESATTGAVSGVYGGETGASNVGYAVQAVNSSATGWGIYSSGTSPNYFAGNVGIGTTNPLLQFEVSKDGGSAGNAASAFSATATDNPTSYLLRGRGTHASPAAVLSGDNLGTLRFVGQYDTTVGHYTTSAYIGALAAENFSASAGGSTLVFYTTPVTTATPTEKMRIDNAGNVGIGTTSPTAPLDVTSDGTSGAQIRIHGTNNANEISMSLIPTGALSSSNMQWSFGRAYGVNAFAIRSWDGTTDASRLYIDSSGNVGIGTASPATPLDVNGYIRGTNVAALTADFTDANAAGLQIITGLSFTLPASVALNVPFECNLMYSQATMVSDSFGIGLVTYAPTRIDAEGVLNTAITGTTATAALTNLTTTTPTAIVSGTPATTNVVYFVRLSGVVQNASNAGTNTLNFYVSQATAADVVKVKAGSWCKIW